MHDDYIRRREEQHNWCDVEYEAPRYGDTGRYECRRPKGHEGKHDCPGQDDCDEGMDYVRRSLGITIPEEGIST